MLSTNQREIYEYWSKAAFWEIDEAAALLLGLDPKLLRREWQPQMRINHDSWRQWKDLSELLSRAVTARQISFNNGPGAIIAWAKRNRIEVPTELEAIVVEHGHDLKDWKSKYQELDAVVIDLRTKVGELQNQTLHMTEAFRAPSTRERESLLKLIIGMAIKGYGYNPQVARSSIAKEIASDLALAGLPLDEDTVRKYLTEARQLLPGDETEFG